MSADVLERFEGVRAAGADQWTARCPAHEDRVNSLSLRDSEGTWLVKCHAGCNSREVVAAAGIEWSDLFPERDASDQPDHVWPYHDEAGNLLYEVLRYPGKRFVQRAADGSWSLKGVRRVPYRLPHLLAGVKERHTVFVVEGEKDADRLRAEGFVATCNSGGAGKWSDDFAAFFTGCKRVVILPDNDEPGRQHAERVQASLASTVADVRIVNLGVREKGDVSDWFVGGGTADHLREIVVGPDLTLTLDEVAE